MSRKETDVTDMLATIHRNRDKVMDILSADIDTADTHLLMSLKQLQHASNGWITIQIAAQTNAIGQAITRMIIQNKA